MDDFFSKSYTRREFLKTGFRLFCLGGASLVAPRFLGAMSMKETDPILEKSESYTASSDTVYEPSFEPAYLKLHRNGELRLRARQLRNIMKSCRLCPRQCGVNRLEGMEGFCRAPGANLMIAAAHPHFGEEKPLVGTGGSGTIFLSHCNLRCVFCQNYTISHFGRGRKTSVNELASAMLQLQNMGCHNINFVTPTHYSPLLVEALEEAAGRGLNLPIVYNTSGWERLEILRLLDGIIDIYLPDFKYWDPAMAERYSAGAESYPQMTRAALLEMHRQTGNAIPSKKGIMERGLMIRHLVMPNNVSGSEKIMGWIAEELPKTTYVNIMAQYTPVYKAYDYPKISRRVTQEEYERVVQRAQKMGLSNLDVQWSSWL